MNLSHSLLINLILVSLFGCKANQESFSKDVTGLGAITQVTERNFTSEELDIGRRICKNLKSKREFFETLTNEKEKFMLMVQYRNCEDTLYSNATFDASISNANPSGLEYIAVRDNFLKDIITDQSAVMKVLCDEMLVTNNVSNTFSTTNFKYVINFLIAGSYDRFEVIKAKKISNARYETISAEGVSIIGRTSQAASKFFGVEKDRIRYVACDSSHFSTVHQSWLEALTNF